MRGPKPVTVPVRAHAGCVGCPGSGAGEAVDDCPPDGGPPAKDVTRPRGPAA
ncbi:hypothetical protein [Streptomyces sp. x-80]|uniref:hypothetical protein n=1 Tax=Streptomyces sp. x-80 TaxID=2789282 RepID=UPI0039801F5C